MKHFETLLENINYSHFTYRVEKLKAVPESESPVLKGRSLRALSGSEIHTLEKQGNICGDWSRLKVVDDFSPEFITQNLFIGDVVLGKFDGRMICTHESSGSLPSGIHRSSIENSHIASGSAVHNCPRIFATLVVRDSLLSNSSTGFTGDSRGTLYGNGVNIPIGIETGGREIGLYSDLSLELAEYVLMHPGSPAVKDAYQTHLSDYLERIRFTWTIIDKHSRILDCRSIINSYIGPYSRILGADEISNSSIFSTSSDPSIVTNSSIIRNSILQDGVEVSDASIIQNSMLFEHSHAEHHGKIVDSIIGPNSGVSKGEITSCFLGPFIGFHHQSLLIAAFWPGGRGNVGYGANVGSNHTSRMPDQECWPGEGMFFGLSCAIKYPANFREAPYSIVAAGVTTLPQKLQYPFSLINEPVGYYLEVPPGFNNLIPAWGLSANLYALKRNEAKYYKRNKAKRNRFDLQVFRPEILEYMRNAVEMLENVRERKTMYLPGDIPGIGKNMLTDENRLKAIEAYRFFLDLVSFREERELILRENTQHLGRTPAKDWEGMMLRMQRLRDMLPDILTRTETSRSRDISRGSDIIPDYQDTHPSVDNESFVLQVRREIEEEQERTEKAIRRIGGQEINL